MKKRITVITAFLLISALLFSACSSNETGHVYQGDDIVIEVTHEPAATSAAEQTQTAQSAEITPSQEQTPAAENTEPAAAPSPQDEGNTASKEGGNAAGGLSAVSVTALARPSLLSGINDNAQTYTANAASYTVKADLSDVSNLDQFYFNDSAKQILADNLFYVQMEASAEFFGIYENNRYEYIPNFVTTDAMMHTYHLYFSYLLKSTEKNYLNESLKTLTGKMLENSLAQYSDLKGSEWGPASLRNCAFFAVAASLLGVPAENIPSEVTDLAEQELTLIYDHSTIAESPLASLDAGEPTYEDYTQYIVRGYYEGDAALESYFRAMMWYGRMNFTENVETLNRSALLMTLAMDSEALDMWEAIYVVTSFFAGASDDLSYYEYRPAIDAVYGSSVTAKDLIGDTDSWTIFQLTTDQMDPPLINSVAFYEDGTDTLEKNKGFRFMGQRFSIDSAIFQNLVYDRVGANDANENRLLPDALDIPAAFGSDEALAILEDRGETKYAGYSENMQQVRTDLANASDSLWNASLYSKWLSTLDPLLNEDRTGWPSFMQSSAWARKDLQTFLGSYAELKHDTVLYSKQIMVEMGGNDYQEKDDRGYVEPEPELFGRLADLTKATSEGLSGYGLLSAEDRDNLDRLNTLAASLETIAEKELNGELPTDEEFELIRGFGGSIEHFWEEVYKGESEHLSSREFPAAIITDIASNAYGSCLEIGTGRVSEIFVIIPIDGQLKICSGGVYSFYEFEQPSSDRLTDSKWRVMMGIQPGDDGKYATQPAYYLEDWTRDFQVHPREQ